MTDLGTTKRKNFSPRQRLSIWEAHKGICCICGEKIDGTRDRWIIEHIRPLALSGNNEAENTAPAHARCADKKTRKDISRIAKAKRQKQKHIGIKKLKGRPLPGTRASGWRKRMDGTVERR